jgi:hypothetical protein
MQGLQAHGPPMEGESFLADSINIGLLTEAVRVRFDLQLFQDRTGPISFAFMGIIAAMATISTRPPSFPFLCLFVALFHNRVERN